MESHPARVEYNTHLKWWKTSDHSHLEGEKNIDSHKHRTYVNTKKKGTNLELRRKIILYKPEFYRTISVLQDTENHDLKEPLISVKRIRKEVMKKEEAYSSSLFT